MKKFFAVLLFIIVIGVIVAWFLKAQIVSICLAKVLKTDVSISKVEIGKSSIKIKGLKIDNPPGFSHGSAFICKEVDISYDLKKLKENPVIIDRIDFFENYLLVECSNAICTDNNWSKIIKHIDDREKELKNKEFIIKKININNLQVDVSSSGGIVSSLIKKRTYIQSIVLEDINSKKGFPTNQLIVSIFRHAAILDFIKETIDSNKIFENYFKSINPFGRNDVNVEIRETL